MKTPRFRAVVLAAGLGTRLRPLTWFHPKPLLPVTGTPIIGHTLSALAGAGCEKVAINLFHHGEEISGRFGRRYEGMELVYSIEEELLGTLGALAPLKDFLAPAEYVVVVNGDSLCRWPVKRVLRQHVRSGARATLLASSKAPLEAFGGGIGLDHSRRVVSLSPSRDHGEVDRRVVFAGLHVFSPDLVSDLALEPADFIRSLYEPMLERDDFIGSLETSRPWFDLGTPAGYLVGVCHWAQRRGPARVASRNWLASGATVDETASLRRSVVETGSRIEPGAQLERSVVLSNASVGRDAKVRDSILGWNVDLPAGTVVERRLVTKARADVPTRERDSVVGGLVYSPLA